MLLTKPSSSCYTQWLMPNFNRHMNATEWYYATPNQTHDEVIIQVKYLCSWNTFCWNTCCWNSFCWNNFCWNTYANILQTCDCSWTTSWGASTPGWRRSKASSLSFKTSSDGELRLNWTTRETWRSWASWSPAGTRSRRPSGRWTACSSSSSSSSSSEA